MRIMCLCFLLATLLLVPMGPRTGLKAGDVYRFYVSETDSLTVEGTTTTSTREHEVVVEVESVEGENITFTVHGPYFVIRTWRLRNTSLIGVDHWIADVDNNGYADIFYVSIAAPFFANPDWDEHESLWDASVTNLKGRPCVVSVDDGIGDGRFYIEVKLKVEADPDNDGKDEKGYLTVRIESKYDSDGVLLSYRREDKFELEESIVRESTEYIRRARGLASLRLPPLSSLSITRKLEEMMPWLPFPIDYLYLLIVLIIGLVIGFVVGRRRASSAYVLPGLEGT